MMEWKANNLKKVTSYTPMYTLRVGILVQLLSRSNKQQLVVVYFVRPLHVQWAA